MFTNSGARYRIADLHQHPLLAETFLPRSMQTAAIRANAQRMASLGGDELDDPKEPTEN